MYVRITEPIDRRASDGVITLTYEEHMLLDGNSYLYSSFTSSLSTGASIDKQLHTSSDYDFLSEYVNISCNQIVKYELYEDTLFSTTGITILPIINRNRNSTKILQSRLYSDAVVSTASTDLGILLRTMIFGAGTLLAPLTGVGKDDIGIHFKKDTDYLVRMTNIGTGTVTALNFIASVYELQTT